MKEQDQILAIAKHRGWRFEDGPDNSYAWYDDKGIFVDRHEANGRTRDQVIADMMYCLPNWLGSRDVIMKATEELCFELTDKWVDSLAIACGNWTFRMYRATAAQLCEAYLRTIDKWVIC